MQTPDYQKAATRALETLVRFGVDSAPINPIPMILSTNVVGFQPCDEMTMSFEGTTTKGLIVSRLVDTDSYAGPWKTELLIEIHP